MTFGQSEKFMPMINSPVSIQSQTYLSFDAIVNSMFSLLGL